MKTKIKHKWLNKMVKEEGVSRLFWYDDTIRTEYLVSSDKPKQWTLYIGCQGWHYENKERFKYDLKLIRKLRTINQKIRP